MGFGAVQQEGHGDDDRKRIERRTAFELYQLTSEQRSQIFALLQKKTAKKEIADIVGTSQSTLSREIRRNSTPSGKYIWTKAHDMAMQCRKRTVKNAYEVKL